MFAAMGVLFALPRPYFVPGTFAATACMLLATLYTGGFARLPKSRALSVALGLCSAALLYAVFVAGSAGISALHPLGIGASDESSIYALIASPGNPLALQVALLAFDAAGYESFFRGVLQKRIQPRFGAGSAMAVALLDGAVHLLTLNPLWVVTTVIADLVWGLTYFYARDLTANLTSHFVWDVMVFIIAPIR